MPEVLGNPPSPRTVLFWNGAAWQWALVDAAGHLQIDVQTILGLEGALQSVATDRLIVRGQDQLFSYEAQYLESLAHNMPGAGNYNMDFGVVPVGELWVVTSIVGVNATAANTYTGLRVFDGASNYSLRVRVPIGAYDGINWSGHVYMVNPQHVRIRFEGCGAGDTLEGDAVGYKMTLET